MVALRWPPCDDRRPNDVCLMGSVSRTLTIVNIKGLHARASAKFVETVEAHDAEARVARDGQSVSGDSIMGLLMLAAARGCEVDVTCTGPDADALMQSLEELIASGFGEGR
jgi:phosphocarrier protein